jgi:hypothetical protein
MNYAKVDAPLTAALKRKGMNKRFIPVFIGVKKGLGQTEIAHLQKSGITFDREIPEIFSATISQESISELSDQEWVRYLKLSSKLKLK